MKVSFIVPVYKVEAYLSECVGSLLGQTYKGDYEILLVDDGSPDNCPALCDEWAKKDSRIKAFHKPNGGLSDARNYGLEHAKGEYVVFVDSDDFWLDKEGLEKLMQIQEQNPEVDFIQFNCSYYYPNSNRFVKWVSYADEICRLTDKNTAICKLVESGTVSMSACLKLIRREFLVRHQLYFVKGQLSEDIPWFINMLEHCDKCLFVNVYIYAYRQNVQGSITATYDGRGAKSLFNIFVSEMEKADVRTFNQKASLALKSFLAYEYCILLSNKNKSDEDRRILYTYKNVLGFTLNPKVRMANRVFRLFGIRITEMVLIMYNRWRASKK